MRSFLALAIVIWLGDQAGAKSILGCREPSRPVCLDFPPTLDGPGMFERCRFDVEQFQRETKEYVECMMEDTQEAIDAAKKAVDQFNCYARGGQVCR